MTSRYHTLRLGILFIMAALLAGCVQAAPPDVSEIQAQPSTTIQVNETASLNVTASGSNLTFAWSAVRGTLSDPTQPSVIYTAPNTPGPDTVTVKVSSGGETTVRSATFQVTAPTASPTPTVTNTPPPTDVPIPTETPPPTTTPTPLPPIACNHLSITENLFPELVGIRDQFPFYGPLGDPRFLCFGVYDIVHTGPLAVKVTYQSDVNEGNFGFWGIGTPHGYDASALQAICFWAYTEQPNQTVRLQLRDTTDVEKGLFVNIPQAGAWQRFCTALTEFAEQGVNLNILENVSLGFNKDTQSSTVWVDDFEFEE
ncbi:MAG TPA: hypothetical protein VJG32_14420 [Anaerolineae bacterium]|nr:hypothetical protein [Anaerolineae bacterium]